MLSALGIICTGLLTAPVLAGTGRIDGTATSGGAAPCLNGIDPVGELFWSAVLNGLIAVPILAVKMPLARRRETIGANTIGIRPR